MAIVLRRRHTQVERKPNTWGFDRSLCLLLFSQKRIVQQRVLPQHQMTEEINQRDTQGRRQGVWEKYYGNGSLWWRAHFLHGKHHGTWKGYNPDGTLKWREDWLHGNPYGLKEWYYSDGTPEEKEYYLTIK